MASLNVRRVAWGGAQEQERKLANPKVLFKGMLPPGWAAIGKDRFASYGFDAVIADQDDYTPEDIHYFSGFRPPPGFMKTLPNLKAIFSLGAGVDGFLRDPDLPRHVPLVRFVDPTLMHEMAQYVVMHVLIVHRGQRFFDAAQKESAWRQRMLARASRDTRIGMLGLGDIGGTIAASLLPFDFQLSGWSRSRKNTPGVKSFAGEVELPQFLAQCDYLVCVLPLTDDTRGIMNAKLFAQLPKGAWVINVARGGHLVEADLIAALDSGHLAGAVLDVFQAEPMGPENSIWQHPKITATPHIAALTDQQAALAFIGDCVARSESGRALENVVDLNGDIESGGTTMINGGHVVIYSKDAEADKAFFRDVLKFPHIDVHQGWLIFKLPPSELAVHPSDENDRHEFFLMTDNLDGELALLKQAGVTYEDPSQQVWGLLARIQLPGGGMLGLYQPRHARP